MTDIGSSRLTDHSAEHHSGGREGAGPRDETTGKGRDMRLFKDDLAELPLFAEASR
jgi:hypothetical protein